MAFWLFWQGASGSFEMVVMATTNGPRAAPLVGWDRWYPSSSPTPMPRNLPGNPDSPQAVIFLASITDVMMGS